MCIFWGRNSNITIKEREAFVLAIFIIPPKQEQLARLTILAVSKQGHLVPHRCLIYYNRRVTRSRDKKRNTVEKKKQGHLVPHRCLIYYNRQRQKSQDQKIKEEEEENKRQKTKQRNKAHAAALYTTGKCYSLLLVLFSLKNNGFSQKANVH